MDLPHGLFLTQDARERFSMDIVNDFLRTATFQPLLDDDSITEIVANGLSRIFAEKGGRMHRVEGLKFDDDAHLRRIIDRIPAQVGKGAATTPAR